MRSAPSFSGSAFDIRVIDIAKTVLCKCMFTLGVTICHALRLKLLPEAKSNAQLRRTLSTWHKLYAKSHNI